MSIYNFIVYFIIVFGIFLNQAFIFNPRINVLNRHKVQLLYFEVIGLFLILISGLRDYNIGLDTYRYYEHFNTITKLPFSEIFNSRLEIGYLCLCYVFYLLIPNFTCFLIFVVTFSIVSSFTFINKYSKNIWLSCLLFVSLGFYYFTFNEIRQSIATSIVVWAIYYVERRKFWKFIFIIIAASMFHKTAFILLPIYMFSYFRRINYRTLFIFIICLLAFFFFVSKIFAYLNSFLIIQYENEEATGGWGLFLMELFTLLLAFIYKKKLDSNRIYLLLFCILSYSIILFPVCHQNPTLFRLGQYPLFFTIVFIPLIISRINNIMFRAGIITFYVIISLILVYSQYTEYNQMLPYTFIQNKF